MRRLASVLLLALASCARPIGPQASNAWARDTVGRTANAAVFMTITSDTEDKLVGASSKVANKTDLMTMAGGSNAMEMTYVDGVFIHPGKPARLSPTGLHVWLDGLKAPLKTGQTFQLTLKFERAGQRRVTVSVVAPAAPSPM